MTSTISSTIDRKNKRQKLNDNTITRRPNIPYEASSSVQLDFNYWMVNDTLTCNDMNGTHNSITNLIISILSNAKPYPIKSLNNSTNNNIIIINATGYNSNTLCIDNMSSFLSQCSSMPVKYSNKNPFKNTTIANTTTSDDFSILEVENMITLLMQPENNTIPWLSILEFDISIKQVFMENTVICTCSCSNDGCSSIHSNSDMYYFTANNNAYNLLINNNTKDDYTTTATDIYDNNDIWGTFICKNAINTSQGIFCLHEVAGQYTLRLIWRLLSKVDILQYYYHPDEDNNDDDNISFFTSCDGNSNTMKLLPHSVKRNIDIYSSITGDSAATKNNTTTTIINPSTTNTTENTKSLLCSTYEEVKSSVTSLLISTDLLTMMGYLDDDTFISTDSTKWNKSNNTSSTINTNNTHIYFNDEVEEGEEVEEEVLVLSDNNYLEICAIDCEMCTTILGLELTRITIICPVNGVMYDTLVKPNNPIINYNTEFSGINEGDLIDVKITLVDVHKVLKKLISKDTIIVGHSLDSDFKALKIIHKKVIDTTALFPHPRGLPYKHSLKKLASMYLNKDIQTGSKEGESVGHDSIEDSFIALELALYKARSFHSRVGSLYSLQLTDYKYDYNLFEHICRNLYFDGINIRPTFSVHGCQYLGDRSDWERHALGYKEDAEICYWANLFQQQLSCKRSLSYLNGCSMRFQSHANSAIALNAAVEEISSSNSKPATMMWIDIPTTDEDDSLDFLDSSLFKLYDTSKQGTSFIIINQNSLLHYKKFLALRQQMQWMQQQKKAANNIGKIDMTNSMKSNYDDIIDSLQTSAYEALHGLLFIRTK